MASGTLIVLAMAGCGLEMIPAEEEAGPNPVPAGVLTVGSVSLNPAQEHDVLRPFVDYLVARLAPVGIGHGRVEVVDSLSRMVAELDSGTVDIYIDSPFPVGFVSQHSEIKVLLRRFKRGADVYRSVVFVREDAEIEAMSDLQGRVMAFGEPFSTSGYLMPKAAFLSAGYELVHLTDAAASVRSGEIGYVFSNDAENTMVWVLKGKVAAGAVNEDYFESLAGSRLGELRVLHRSEPLPRNIVCVRADMDMELVRAVVGVLLAMDEDEEGQAVLHGFEETSRFEPFPEGPEEALSGVVSMLTFVGDDLGQ
jgi:phosphonate transport system substrate-binding protein